MTDEQLLADIHVLAKLKFGESYSLNDGVDEGGKYWILYRYKFKDGYIIEQKRLHRSYSLRNMRTHLRLNYFM